MIEPEVEKVIVEYEDLIYELNLETKVASVVSNCKICGDVLIPKSINHESEKFFVTSIDGGSFKNSREITSIQFPLDSEVESFEKEAFADSSIESLFFPSSVKYLKKGWCRGTSQ